MTNPTHADEFDLMADTGVHPNHGTGWRRTLHFSPFDGGLWRVTIVRESPRWTSYAALHMWSEPTQSWNEFLNLRGESSVFDSAPTPYVPETTAEFRRKHQDDVERWTWETAQQLLEKSYILSQCVIQ